MTCNDLYQVISPFFPTNKIVIALYNVSPKFGLRVAARLDTKKRVMFDICQATRIYQTAAINLAR